MSGFSLLLFRTILRIKLDNMCNISPPTIRLWVTEDLATSQDLLPLHC